MRDFQRARLYRAEPPPVTEFTDLAEAVAFVQKVQTSRWWKAQVRAAFSNIPIRVVRARGAWARTDWDTCGPIPTIGLCVRWALNRHTILHEMAHVGAGQSKRHGPAFASLYLKLVRRFIGPEWARMLRASFIHNRVKFRARKVKQV